MSIDHWIEETSCSLDALTALLIEKGVITEKEYNTRRLRLKQQVSQRSQLHDRIGQLLPMGDSGCDEEWEAVIQELLDNAPRHIRDKFSSP